MKWTPRPRTSWMFAVLVVLCAAGFAVEAGQQYRFSPAGNFPGQFTTTMPVAVSLSHIVGYYTAPNVARGYIQTGTQFIDPEPKGAVGGYFSGINRNGIAVGGFCTVACGGLGGSTSYTYNFRTKAIVTFFVPGSPQGTVAFGINDLGDIVGGYCPGASGCPQGLIAPTHGFLLADKKFTTLDFPDPLITGTDCTAINNAGTVVGWYNTDSTENGFIYQNGVYTLLDFPGASATFPTAINNSGVIAGQFIDSGSNTHGFTYQSGAFTQVDVPPQQASITGVSGINDAGMLVGVYIDTEGSLRNFKAVPKHSTADGE